MTEDNNGIKLTPAQEKSRTKRNWAIGGLILLLFIIFYLITILKLGHVT